LGLVLHVLDRVYYCFFLRHQVTIRIHHLFTCVASTTGTETVSGASFHQGMKLLLHRRFGRFDSSSHHAPAVLALMKRRGM
jgi:hypothetical protein